jgi:hypothetical protein
MTNDGMTKEEIKAKEMVGVFFNTQNVSFEDAKHYSQLCAEKSIEFWQNVLFYIEKL